VVLTQPKPNQAEQKNADGEKKEPSRADLAARRKQGEVLSTQPGIYLVEFVARQGQEPEYYAFAVNVDTTESDLRRAASEKLLSVPPNPNEKNPRVAQLRMDHYLDADELIQLDDLPERKAEKKEQEPDASETPWLYLILLLFLVAEQAMAVHLSRMTGAGDETAAPSRPQAAGTAAASPSAA
jgi:hypothetical protein